MKARYAVLLVMLAALAAVLGQKALAGQGGDNGEQGGIPLPTGQFSTTVQGSFAICLNPTTFAQESCSTSGAFAIPLSSRQNGVSTIDASGNSCQTFMEVDSVLPLDASSPSVTNGNSVGKLLNYDSMTGTGDSSFTSYTGGACHGATFDSAGATEVFSGTLHFVVTSDGKRIDILITKLTNPIGSIGNFSTSGTNLRQTRPES
jgi:hypothetical protein